MTDQEKLSKYRRYLKKLQSERMSFPLEVSIETWAHCNATCDFCPYSELNRKGQKMSTDLFHKIIGDLENITNGKLLLINLSRVNEPFLDPRIFEFSKTINQKLPFAQLCFYTNGSVLSKEKQQKLLEIQNIYFFVISLNDHRPSDYKRKMGLSFERTTKYLDNLHRLVELRKFIYPVIVSKISEYKELDNEFITWCNTRYPCFEARATRLGQWLDKPVVNNDFPDAGCTQWFKVNILSNGKAAYCSIDSEGSHGIGDVTKETITDIYMHASKIALRKSGISRKLNKLCSSCSLLA